MRHFIRQVLQDIRRGENIDLLVTVVLALVIAVLNGLGYAPPDLVSSITLAALGLIAIGLLVTRYRLEDIHRAKAPADATRFLMHRPPSLATDLAAAKEVWMTGITLRGTTTGNFYDFKKKAERRARFRTLIVNVDKIDMHKVLRQFSRGGTEEQFRADFKQTLNQFQEIRQTASNAENVQLRLLDFIPPFRLYIFPKLKDGGVAYVEIYNYRASSGAVPKLRITEREQPEWYDYFAGQFETMWEDAKAANLA